MIENIKKALEAVQDGPWITISPQWLAALVEYYEAAEAWRGAAYETPEFWAKWVAARKKLEGL